MNPDPAKIRAAILGILPDVKAGTLRIWGDWFGRPHDDVHRIVGADSDDCSVTITFEGKETLRVWHPAGVQVGPDAFRILQAERVRWEWFYYGRPQLPQNRYFLDYAFHGGTVRGSSNVDWYSPRFETDPAMPAVELV